MLLLVVITTFPMQASHLPLKLNCLPIRQRIIYKSLLLTHTTIHLNSPTYLSSLVPLQPIPKIQTRSNNTHFTTISSKYHNHTTTLRSWSLSAPYSWNTIILKQYNPHFNTPTTLKLQLPYSHHVITFIMLLLFYWYL